MSFLHMVTKIHAQHALLSDSGDIQPHCDCPYWSLPALVYFQKEERRKSRNHHQMFVVPLDLCYDFHCACRDQGIYENDAIAQEMEKFIPQHDSESAA